MRCPIMGTVCLFVPDSTQPVHVLMIYWPYIFFKSCKTCRIFVALKITKIIRRMKFGLFHERMLCNYRTEGRRFYSGACSCLQ